MSNKTSPGTLKMRLDPDIIKLFRDTFKGREDIVAKRWVSKKQAKQATPQFVTIFGKKMFAENLKRKNAEDAPMKITRN